MTRPGNSSHWASRKPAWRYQPAGCQPVTVRARALTSDGIHTASDASDGYFTVPNRPPLVEIVQPEEWRVAVAGQTVFLEALVYDVDMETIGDLDIQWRSDLDGPLGQGMEFSTASLSVGTHLTMALADDGAGDVGVDMVCVTVVADYDDLPPRPAQLMAAPDALHLSPCSDVPNGKVFVHNIGNLETIS
jgi:hypothetical protein